MSACEWMGVPARLRRGWVRCVTLGHVVKERLGSALPSPLRAETSPFLDTPKFAEETTVQLSSRRPLHVRLDDKPLLGLPKGASPFDVPKEDRANRCVRMGANPCAEMEPGGFLHDRCNGWGGRKSCRPAPNLQGYAPRNRFGPARNPPEPCQPGLAARKAP